MRHSQLSNEQILLALSESYNIVAAITKYQVFLASGIGLPKDDVARSEIMSASINVVEKIRTEIRALEHELVVEKNKKKGAFEKPLGTGTITSPF
jgi:predicted HAD superfamily phosphohydrolase